MKSTPPMGTARFPRQRRRSLRRPRRAQSGTAAASGDALALMDERDNAGVRELFERIAFTAVGAVALTAERADALAEELAERGLVRRDEARALIDDVSSRWRGDATRMGERAGATLDALFRELGLVTKDEVEDLELRIAQLEHRLALLEEPETRVSPPSVQH
jgi:polyhydroxyalkanoate synthesis regulator phasin